MSDIYQESIKLHKKYKGKLETNSKIKIKTTIDLSRAYTPGVAEISRIIFKNPTEAKKMTLKNNTIAVISDGSAILGLGNLGAKAAIPVMEGKCILFKEFAGVDAFPICLDTQDTEEIIKTIKYIAPVFGGINLEDISAPRCFEIETRLKSELDIPILHDDQHGTAVVTLAALINAMKLINISKENIKIVINGAGAAGVATTKLFIQYGIKNIIVCDSKGAIYKGRNDLNQEKQELADITNKQKQTGLLSDIIVGADVFFGVSKAGLLKPAMIKNMNTKPVIFAMANPIPEIMPELAKKAGAYIIATGRSDYPNQTNNVLAFPGLFRGALDNNITNFTDTILIRVAKVLANCVKNPSTNKILPNPLDKSVVTKIAKAVY
ncbi:MAG: malate dehydrogenase [Candidatus Magasanikbacteria bacterium RIFCSPHIGHO2_01_FULL_33_34]|uniref:Malate dehydrogenase n=1 Tax=Candidatus Magasanikbacteria bacterium RIFCSPHIGHO2_01_FULL_33_34 TaxID=1798671 RepID=A0A1F6LHS7_9BACT|nr:MAG: malate dehydrogenase [Candidatus Magasanikbacteria bacterium RIFCSPHIGHO2_01_FULL_33_34]OGH65103.1 MAG: malate dehydrogenase [Candidatus Magasanikbacteria bacterium RIFCSPHIGHO2_02_FULL_33_17]OGH75353.1 MAG: malate dehydrogenase [Candidatus Magasanikbacteria bacterium RIFCSPLOWO2_01_FULL_33_34]OGH81813.1 MAG: malate dehydrogenase [Candidatus Magasanikbacteria bacterium RIFCSPLOWO2_12_FULL_34_7]